VPNLRLLIALPLIHLREVAHRSLLKPLVHLERGLTLLPLAAIVDLLELLNSFKDLSATELISDVVIEAVRDLLGQGLVLLEVFLLVDH
jgi:hypothetical protein